MRGKAARAINNRLGIAFPGLNNDGITIDPVPAQGYVCTVGRIIGSGSVYYIARSDICKICGRKRLARTGLILATGRIRTAVKIDIMSGNRYRS